MSTIESPMVVDIEYYRNGMLNETILSNFRVKKKRPARWPMPERSCTGVSFISELVVFTVVIGRRKNCRFYDDRHDQPTLTCDDGNLSTKRIRHCKSEKTQYTTVMYSQVLSSATIALPVRAFIGLRAANCR